ncbi:OmpA family protein [Capnocytophaga canis]|uniref:OmpA family protein n=1 Tax=Capnocytophaga canis TaxID=1848903 RepID=A0A0B7ITP4_9FLAO|nr:OmpA family protein [Capnocytophaga canis]CEN53477.1 OmpA family protein [Capnocytophaga canis]
MKMKFLKTLLMFFGALFFGFSQTKELIKAHKLYKNYDYVGAIKAYESIAKKGFVNQDLLQNLGNAYYYNADYESANIWYEQLFSKEEYKKSSEYYYRYAQTLKSVGKLEDSDKIMDKFVAMVGKSDARAVIFNKNRSYRKDIELNSNRLELQPLKINSPNSEYGTAFYGKKIVFSKSSGLFKGKSTWTGDAYYDLYEAKRDCMNVSKVSKMNKINTRFNESTAVFTKDGNTIYFTRNNFLNNKIKTNGDDTVLLKIFKSTKDKNGKWSKEKEMPFNSNIHNVAHPALSPDEKYLYFASDMRGSFGASDIYRVERLEKGGYGKPENLGNVVNTAGRESFPFVSKDNILYYSSDGYPGLGGLDIFAVKINEDGSFSKPVNIGAPANSSKDDFCFVIDSDTKVGFLTSNRVGGKGKDDIYAFQEHRPVSFSCTKNISGIVRNATTREIIKDAGLVLRNADGKPIETKLSDVDGNFSFAYEIDCTNGSTFNINAEKQGFIPKKQEVIIKEKDELFYEIALTPIERRKIEKGTDLAKVLKIDNIYFNYDKADIRPDAAEQLAKIVDVMKEYPTMKIDVRLHTDSRGSDKYNLALSDRRAKSTIKWLVKHGIKKSRITGKGYGETQLTNHCGNGVKCSEEEHQANRRSEFIIISM